jgi:hypothetical protein
MLSEYRQRFSEFHTNLNREDFLCRAGIKETREEDYIYSEYSELFELSVVSDLRAKLQETPDHRETERKSIAQLIAFAIEGHSLKSVRDLGEEIDRYESGAQIDWAGKKIRLRLAAGTLAAESDAVRRRDLYARCADIFDGAQDLRRERLEKLAENARAFGYENRVVMHRELRGIDCEALADKTKLILARTESRYASLLSGLIAREAGVSIDDAACSDAAYLRRFERFDHFFTRERMMDVYRNLFAALGFNAEKQTNLEIDTATRPAKQSQAFCSPIRVPDEVKLSVNLTGGQANYLEFLRESGHAQHYAWTSRNIHPEFRIAGDRAVQLAWGMLFEDLMLEERWLAGSIGFIETAQFRSAQAVLRLMAARENAALLRYESEVYSGGLGNNPGARFVELMTDATLLRHGESEHLRAFDDPFFSAAYLRGCAFEMQLREHLKTKFGLRWWASRKAGEMLIDLWNTGQRHRVEELASIIGLGELDFDWLANELLNQTD